jgi:hypothetical protein
MTALHFIYINKDMNTFLQFLESKSSMKANTCPSLPNDIEGSSQSDGKKMVVFGDQLLIHPNGLNDHD